MIDFSGIFGAAAVSAINTICAEQAKSQNEELLRQYKANAAKAPPKGIEDAELVADRERKQAHRRAASHAEDVEFFESPKDSE